MKSALITGVTGQDGSYMADLLLQKGYKVIGTIRDPSAVNRPWFRTIGDSVELHQLDLLDEGAIRALLTKFRPDEIYNFAARASSSQLSDDPLLTTEINAVAVVKFLEAVRVTSPSSRLCQASSSEIFGAARHSPQDEATEFRPRNPYGIAKLYGHWFVGNYRETHGTFACSAILYNHESPRRGAEFVTRKISRAVARIKCGREQHLQLGDLEARRDWGYAAEYVLGMWMMLQAPTAGDYVLATGETHSVREFCEIAFHHAGLRYEDHVMSDPAARRTPERVPLVGNAAKACEVLGWQPRVPFAELVCMMVDEDMRIATEEGDSG